MVSRISLAVGLLGLLAPALGAQATIETTPRVRLPRLLLDSASLALSYTAPLVAGPDAPAPVSLRFAPFTRESREGGDGGAQALPSLPTLKELPQCPMPVQRVRSVPDSMPVATPDSTTKYFILVAPPGCVAEPSR
jgi:hypothetical protein